MRKKILIVDDYQDILDVMQVILEDEGYEVQTSLNGSYFHTLDSDWPDLIFLDVLLSGEDGRDLCRQLKSDEKTRHIPVILISAHIDSHTAISSCEADDFLAKPFRMSELRETARKWNQDGAGGRPDSISSLS